MKTRDFDYSLPENLIAQTPLKNRLDSRLLVMNRFTGVIRHEQFSHLHRYLKPDDVLIINNTKVIPARLVGTKVSTGAAIEVLLLSELGEDTWECLVKKAKKIKVGTTIAFGQGQLKMVCVQEKAEGLRDFRLIYDGILYEILDALGQMPLPPYIHEKLEEPDRYQTVYSEEKGSAAAPTAGLHFTSSYLEKLKARGITIVPITLHVGLGTFRPVNVTDVEKHKMHAERYAISKTAADTINAAKQAGRRIVAVGSTSMRTLETAHDNGHVLSGSGVSELFIYPGFTFKIVDALITNFHLPQSTLLMLVSAFSKKTHIMHAYQTAIEEKYRFFSFGDAMFLTDDPLKKA